MEGFEVAFGQMINIILDRFAFVYLLHVFLSKLGSHDGKVIERSIRPILFFYCLESLPQRGAAIFLGSRDMKGNGKRLRRWRKTGTQCWLFTTSRDRTPRSGALSHRLLLPPVRLKHDAGPHQEFAAVDRARRVCRAYILFGRLQESLHRNG